MKATISLLLAVTLLACPLVCRAETDGCCADAPEDRPAGAPRLPEPSRTEISSCLCGGAIRDADPASDSQAEQDGPGCLVPPAASSLPPAHRSISGRHVGHPLGSVLIDHVRLHLRLRLLRC